MAKRALLIGCNYPGTQAALRGCVNDVTSMNSLLQECYGFAQSDIVMLVDDPSYGMGTASPTGANIKKQLGTLVAASQPGDVMVFHFSGHGTQVTDKDGGEADNKDEAIVPTDMNLICDDDLRIVLKPLKEGVLFTMVSDCCHSGSMLDHPEQQITGNKDPNAPPGAAAMDPMDMLGMFFKDIPGGVVDDNKNRALPQNLFCKLLGDKFGMNVLPGSIHSSLQRSFGGDASAKSLAALGMLKGVLEGYAKKNQGTRSAGGIKMLMGLLTSCMGATQGGGAPAAGGGGGEPNLAAASGGGGTAGEATSAQGVLITGCQSHETSADACPSGDPKKAFGALTNALTTSVRAVKKNDPNASVSYKALVQDVRSVLLSAKFTQNPCLECVDADVDKAFIC